MEIGAVDTQMVGDLLNGDGVAVAALDEIQRFFHVVRFFFIVKRAPARKFLRKQIEIFIHNTVHLKIAVLRQLVGLKHFLVAEPQLFVRSVVNHESVPQQGPLQIPLYLYPLHTDPRVAPGIISICLIVNQLAGADEEGIACFQAKQFSAGLVNAAAAQHIMDEPAVAQNRAVAVAFGTVFIAAGVDHGINIPEKII